jgi:hypothetical protein
MAVEDSIRKGAVGAMGAEDEESYDRVLPIT